MQLIDSMVPSSAMEHPEHFRKARLLIQLTLFIAGAALLFSFVYWILGFAPGSIAVLVSVVIAILNIVLFKNTGSFILAGNTLMLLMLSVLTFLPVLLNQQIFMSNPIKQII